MRRRTPAVDLPGWHIPRRTTEAAAPKPGGFSDSGPYIFAGARPGPYGRSVRALVWLVGFAVLSGGSGCLSGTQRRQETLARASREFTEGLRWGRYDQVASHLSAEEARLFSQRLGYVGPELAMADAEITSINLADDATHATVIADFSWYNQRKALVRSATLQQEWAWQDGRWLCVSQRRLRGDRFPLVPEPLATPTPADPPSAPNPPAPAPPASSVTP